MSNARQESAAFRYIDQKVAAEMKKFEDAFNPDAQQCTASLRARFTSGNETPVEKATVPAAEALALLAYIAELEADAARYRYLRQYPIRIRPWGYESKTAEGLDAAIDATRKEGRRG